MSLCKPPMHSQFLTRVVLGRCAFVCLLIFMISGCSQMTSWKMKDWEAPSLIPAQEAKTELPGRVMAIWTDAIHHKQGASAERGFGGRIVFYNDSKTDPIQVDGTLTVYAFADEDGNQSKRPEKKFVIGREQLKQHHSRCSLGDSYSIWLPWDAVGGPSRQLSLITRFDGINGGTVMSDPARKLLPGTGPETLTTHQKQDSTLPLGAVELTSSSREKNKSLANNLFEDTATSEGNQISLASFISESADPTKNQTASKVETVDLNSVSKMSQTQTFAVPTALGMRRFDHAITAQGAAVETSESADSRSTLDHGVHDSGAYDNAAQPARVGLNAMLSEEIANPRVEKHAGATVYYGRPGQAATQREAILNEASANAADDNRFQNYQADSLRLREDQLGQVKDARQQFRSEPWRFPVRTQVITRPTRVDAGY